MRKKYHILPLILLLICAGCIWYLMKPPENKQISKDADVSESNWEEANNIHLNDREWDGTINYQGGNWTPNRSLTTILLLGIDKMADVKVDQIICKNGRSDVIMLLVLDQKTMQMQIIEISRDTMTEVDVYDSDGSYVYSGEMQLTLQYSVGENTARGCWLTKRTISEMLYDTHIDGCLSLTIDGMVKIADAMGGVPVTFDADWSDIDPRYALGYTCTMNGDDIERFIRYRDINETGSNDERMSRQEWFIPWLLKALQKKGTSTLLSLYDEAGDEIYSDLDAETLAMLSKYTIAEEGIRKLPGNTTAGELHDEYYLDMNGVKDLVIKTFYVQAE